MQDLFIRVPHTLTEQLAVQPSHARAIGHLSRLPREDALRTRCMGLILRMRYADAPFVSAYDAARPTVRRRWRVRPRLARRAAVPPAPAATGVGARDATHVPRIPA